VCVFEKPTSKKKKKEKRESKPSAEKGEQERKGREQGEKISHQPPPLLVWGGGKHPERGRKHRHIHEDDV
jgi:hypothetical protein